MRTVVQVIMATHAGMTSAEFETILKDWIATARHSSTGLDHLSAHLNGFGA
jgi:hypothetical protein